MAVEDQPGVYVGTSTLNAVANAKVLVTDPQAGIERSTYTREINRASFTPFTPIEGTAEGTITGRVELAGTNAYAVGTPAAPDWDLLLQACGFKSRQMGVGTLTGTPSGPHDAFFSAETVSDADSDSAEVVHDSWNGATKLYYADPTGTLNTSFSGGTSGEDQTISGVNDDAGWCWTPTSRPVVTLTFSASRSLVAGDILVGDDGDTVVQVISTASSTTHDVYWLDPGDFLTAGEVLTNLGTGDTSNTLAGASFVEQKYFPSLSIAVIEDGVFRAIKGARGSVNFSANLGEPMFMDFTFRGLIAAITDGALAGTPTPTALVPPSFLNISYGVAEDDPAVEPSAMHVPCLNSWSCNFENTLALEKCAASTDGVRGAAIIGGRAVTGSLDPSVRPESQFPFLQNFRDGTTFRQRLTIGSTAENSFHISVPASQITSEGGGDRDGVATRDLQYSASGKAPNGSDLEDREFVLSLHQVAVYTD